MIRSTQKNVKPQTPNALNGTGILKNLRHKCLVNVPVNILYMEHLGTRETHRSKLELPKNGEARWKMTKATQCLSWKFEGITPPNATPFFKDY